jgi:hypothetical protein
MPSQEVRTCTASSPRLSAAGAEPETRVTTVDGGSPDASVAGGDPGQSFDEEGASGSGTTASGQADAAPQPGGIGKKKGKVGPRAGVWTRWVTLEFLS